MTDPLFTPVTRCPVALSLLTSLPSHHGVFYLRNLAVRGRQCARGARLPLTQLFEPGIRGGIEYYRLLRPAGRGRLSRGLRCVAMLIKRMLARNGPSLATHDRCHICSARGKIPKKDEPRTRENDHYCLWNQWNQYAQIHSMPGLQKLGFPSPGFIKSRGSFYSTSKYLDFRGLSLHASSRRCELPNLMHCCNNIESCPLGIDQSPWRWHMSTPSLDLAADLGLGASQNVMPNTKKAGLFKQLAYAFTYPGYSWTSFLLSPCTVALTS
jgi:hypothetical protein